MAGEKPLPKEATAEAPLGLKSKLIERTSPLPDPKVFRGPKTVFIDWEPNEEGFSGGEIQLELAEKVRESSDTTYGEPKMVTSYFETGRCLDSRNVYAGREGLAAVLTMIATINEAAQKTDDGSLLHVVRANKGSRPFFERFRRAGLYYYCDKEGNRTQDPVEITKGTYVLFACRYPVPGLDSVVGKFSPEQAADLLCKLKQEAENR